MSFYYSPSQSESYETFQSRDEQRARFSERRYQASRELYGEETHCRDEHDYDDENFVPVPAMLTEAGVSPIEGAEFLEWIDRKPVVVERMQMSLFPEVA